MVGLNLSGSESISVVNADEGAVHVVGTVPSQVQRSGGRAIRRCSCVYYDYVEVERRTTATV